MLITSEEIFEIIIMAVAVGYIFSTVFRRKPDANDPISFYSRNSFFENLKYGIILAGPAVVLHELAHKFVAMGFGASAEVNAPLFMYGLVILMRMLNFPLIFFVGGYVTIHGSLLPWQSALVSFAGPMTNLVIYALLLGAVRFKIVKKKHHTLLEQAAKLNLFLFGFNMIPFPGFDGYSFFTSLLNALSGLF